MNPDSLISIVIPTLNYINSTEKLFNALSSQTLLPDEIVVVDSSESNKIQEIALLYEKFFKIKYLKVEKAFPGEARNLGISNATNRCIALLDAKTIPNRYWLETNFNLLINQNVDIVFGSTKYQAESLLQFILLGCIYGKKPLETTPGSIMIKDVNSKIGFFQEGIRASDDLDWRNRIRQSNLTFISPNNGDLTYSEISKKFSDEIKRHFIYQFHSALTEVQMNTKIFIFGISLLLISLIIPHWNAIVGWDDSLLYVPHITRGFFYIFSIFAIIILTSSKFIKLRSSMSKFIGAIFVTFSLYIASQWNQVIASWADESFLYIPHITKSYILFLISVGFLFRAIYKPFVGGLSLKEVLPFNWLLFGLFGFILDIAKFPGYIFGAINALLRTFK